MEENVYDLPPARVRRKDGTARKIPLKILKESNPIETAQFMIARNIQDESAFSWWIPCVMRKRDRIISTVNSRVKKVTHKYSVAIPNSVEDCFKLDKSNGKSLWRDALSREMNNLRVPFDILEDKRSLPPGYTKSSGHIIFDVRMTLERIASWVKDDNKTRNPDNCTYAEI